MKRHLLYIVPLVLMVATTVLYVREADSADVKTETSVEADAEPTEKEYISSTVVTETELAVEPKTRARLVKAGVADTLKCDGAVLYIYENSLKTDKEISVTALTEKQLPHIPESMVNVTGINAGYRFLPHGEHFTECKAVMGIPLDTLRIPDGYTVADVRTYYYSEKLRRWEELEGAGIDIKSGMAYAVTSHFTDVINGILKVPESPETGAVAPTFIQNYRSVSPVSGMNLIEAPTPSSSGDAKINYRFRLPDGRGGMTPDLALCYSSGAASGYVGYGFSIPMEKIEIDTRWGVPQFSSEYETECYLLNGEPFTKKAHNHFVIDSTTIRRQNGDVRFFLRTGGEGLEIVRHGTSPKDYSWTITDKNGTVKTFTGFAANMDSVCSDTKPSGDGFIIEWVLTKATDSNGNTIEYRYENRFNVLYPIEIEYTGYEEGDSKEGGYYKVQFHYPRKAELALLQKKIRPDVLENRRMGVVCTDRNRLDSLTVTAGGEFLRSYSLKYTIGAFSKTLLTSVTEYDSQKNPFYTHSFNYYNNVPDGKLFGDAEQWETDDCGYGSGFMFNPVKPGFEDELTMIGGASSNGWSVGGGAHVSVGFGNFVNVYSGASYNYSSSDSKGRSTMADINGDGVPDIIFLKGDTLCYRAGNTDSKHFGPIVKVTGAKKYSEGKSESHNLLVDAGAQFFFISGNACYSHNWQKSVNTIYLHDFNADGLVDIGYNGKVLFNHINSKGEVEFSSSSKNTPCPIPGLSVEIDKAFIPDVAAEKERMAARFPLHDVVRVWRAPYKGKINIRYRFRASEKSLDGVTISVQRNDKMLVNKKELNPGSSGSASIGCNANEGDTFYFRVQSNDNAVDDDVFLPIDIEYSSVESKVKEGENGSLIKFSSEKDFLFCGVPDVPLQREGSVHISAPFSKGVLSDNITLVVTKNVVRISGGDTTVVSTDINRRHLDAANVHENEPMETYLTVSKQDVENGAYLSFRVECASQINWELVKWKPTVTYNGESEPFMYVAPHFTMYNHHVKAAPGVKFKGMANITPKFSGKPVDNTKTDMKVNFSLKDSNGSVYYSGRYKEGMSFQANLDKEAMLYGSFHTDHDAEVNMAIFSINGVEHEASVYSVYDNNYMGHLYHGWGQFAYRGEGDEKDAPIKESLLNFDTEPYTSVANGIGKNARPEDIDSTKIDRNKMSSLPTVNDHHFFTMNFVPKENRYCSIAKNSYVSGTEMASSRIGRQSLDVQTPEYPAPGPNGTPASETACPHLTMSGEGNGFTGSAGAIANVGGGYCVTTSYSDQMIQDINGDGYPDWINRTDGGVKVQLTCSDGRLTAKKQMVDFTPSKSRSESKNITAGLSISTSTPDLVASIGKKGAMSDMEIRKVDKESRDGGMSLSVGGDFGSNNLISEGEFVDVNGDGLPDYITLDGNVRYNEAGVFKPEPTGFTSNRPVFAENSQTKGAGVGVSVSICGKATAGGGASGSKTSTRTTAEWRDMNGDGLPDYVCETDNGIMVGFNTGTEVGDDWKKISAMGASESVGSSVSCNVAVPVPILWVTLTPSTTGGETKAVSRTTRAIIDVDGDGFPDVVESNANNTMTVRRSLIGNTNLLKEVVLPTGTAIDIDYALSPHSCQMPLPKRVMSKVEIKEYGLKDTITYSGGFYNRCERTFCGYDTVCVQTKDPLHADTVCRTVKTAYSNKSFYTRHLPLERTLFSSKGVKMETESYSYTLKGDSGYMGKGIFPALTKQVTTLYGADDNLVKTRTFDYDEYGNLTAYSVDSDLDARIEYHKNGAVRSVPSHITVSGLMERSSRIDDRGNVTQLTVKTGTSDAVYDMEYDKYGNIVKHTRPDNGSGERVWTKLIYESLIHANPVDVSDSYGSHILTVYDPLHVSPSLIQNYNYDFVSYTYDACGRVAEEVRDKDYFKEDRYYSLRFEYNKDDRYRSSKTYHNTPDGEFAVTTYIDGIGRSCGMMKPSAIYSGGAVKIENVVSGVGLYDAMNHRTIELKPVMEEDIMPETELEKEYDALDRITSITQPNGAKYTYSYAVTTDDVTGKAVLSTTVTDPNGHKATTLSDDRGRAIGVIKHSEGNLVRTTTEYDALDRPVKVTHPNGTESTYSYDMQGNLVRQTTPDAGTESYTYTPARLLKERNTATGVKIAYKYSMDRLTSIKYSDSSDSVAYIYSDSTASDRQKNRLVEVRDASGTERYTYGDMGVITKTLRTINIDTLRHLRHTYVYGAEYDSWGRVREMTYPDGEKVIYGYYPTGELKSITGQNNGKEDAYLVSAGYNVYGQTVYRKLGNGTEHIYAFDENNRLENSTLQMHGQTITSNTYRYDGADNITDITQIGGGNYYQHYEYDDLDRLVKATGRDNTPYGDAPYGSYTMNMVYNIMSSPVKFEKDINGKYSKNDYLYGIEEHPNAPQQVGETQYTYSKSGNPLTITGADVDRSLTWDAENRLRMMEDRRTGMLHLYTYNHAGERALKRFGTAQTVAVNGLRAATLLDVSESYSAYVSPYFTENSNRYTKHYYAGTMRLASKIGGAVYKGVEGEQAGGGNSEQEPSENAAELNPGDTYMAGTDEPDLYFYFTDHLGSTTYITDREEVAQYVAYTPYGETFKEYRNVTPYKFNGKERDDETGYYYYGARYYDPGTALWFGTDPLQHKYPMNSPYVYCNGNPVKYVDLDGNAPWENDNIQRARNDASNIGGSVNLVQGEYGIDAQILNNRGEVVNTRYATAGNQKTPLRNFVETIDKGGYAHAGGTTDITKQDIAVATGVIGVITGGMALAGGALIVGSISAVEGIASVAGILSSIDDIGTNTKGESLLQQNIGSEIGKLVTSVLKSGVSVINFRFSYRTLKTASDVSPKCIGITDIINSIISNVNSWFNE